MQDYRDGFMSVLFIECPSLLKEFPEWQGLCCSSCHNDENKATHKIYIRPIGKDGVNADWYLCVEAIVCCGLYHRVRALPYEWWVAKSVAAGVRRDDGSGYRYTDSVDRNTERPERTYATPQRKTYQRSGSKDNVSDRERDEAGGLKGWLEK